MRGILGFLKWVFGIGLVTASLLAVTLVFLGDDVSELLASMRDQEGGVEVRTEIVEPGRLVRTVGAPAQIMPRMDVNISARVSARIVEMPVEPGDFVEKGELLVQLEDQDFQADLESSMARLGAEQARLEATRATYVNAVSEWERAKTLFESQDLSKAELDSAEAELNRAEANVREAEQNIAVAEAQVARAEENLSYTTIYAPLSGYATRVFSKVGETVLGTANNIGTTIMTLADFSEIHAIAEVDESDIAQVDPGQTARVYINAFPDRVFEGKVDLIDMLRTTSRAGADVFEVQIVLALEEKDARRFFAGLSASVDIEVETLEDVLIVPSQAVLDVRVEELPSELRDDEQVDPNKTFARVVYTIEEGAASAIPVKVGPSDLRRTAILAGLESGTELIVGPYRALIDLKHGDEVRRESQETDGDAGEDESSTEPDGQEAA